MLTVTIPLSPTKHFVARLAASKIDFNCDYNALPSATVSLACTCSAFACRSSPCLSGVCITLNLRLPAFFFILLSVPPHSLFPIPFLAALVSLHSIPSVLPPPLPLHSSTLSILKLNHIDGKLMLFLDPSDYFPLWVLRSTYSPLTFS